MKITQNIQQFLFHPLSKKHSTVKKSLAVVTVVALSILTASAFFWAFVAINTRDNHKAMKMTNMTPSSTKAVQLNQTIAPQKKPTPASTGVDMQKVKTVKNKHLEQLREFERWAKQEKWEMFHHEHSHYDWWMFPIDRGSAGQGFTYTVYAPEIAYLKNDPEFIRNFRRGAELVAKSWGWDIKTGTPILNPKLSQQWEHWPVRLGKMADSLRLFDQKDYHANIQKFAVQKLKNVVFPPWINNALGIEV